MTDKLTKATVLVLNCHWQAINVRSPADAFCQMAAGVALGLDISRKTISAVTWTEWVRLEVRDRDSSVATPRGAVRVPTVIVAKNFAKVPKRRPNFSARSIWNRDGGKCQYTGRVLKPEEGNIDHVVPRSRGGATSWENCVLSHREVNTRKGNRLPQEAGLKLLRVPSAPKELPATVLIRNAHDIEDWKHFLA